MEKSTIKKIDTFPGRNVGDEFSPTKVISQRNKTGVYIQISSVDDHHSEAPRSHISNKFTMKIHL